MPGEPRAYDDAVFRVRFPMKPFLALTLLVALAGCSLPSFFRVPIVQGNVVTDEKVEQLEKGMTPKQVRFLLGTPLVNSSFDQQRWDYVFYYRDPRGVERQSQLSLFFEDGKLDRITGDEQYQALLPEKQRDIDLEAPGT